MKLFYLLDFFIELFFDCDFREWIQILMKNPESCFINGGKTTPYFKLERGTRQGDPISAYLFILVSELPSFFFN